MKVSIVLDEPSQRSIGSVLEQVHTDWELIVVGEPIEVEHDNVRFVESVKLIDLTGDFVVYLRAGDRLLPSHLYCLLEKFEDPEVVLVHGCTKEFKYKNPERFSLRTKGAVYSSEAMIRKAAMEELDWDGFADLVDKLQDKTVKIPEPVVERFYPEELIDKWHRKREARRRRQMKLSVIIGVKTRARYAKRVIRSLLVQDLPRDCYDIVIVDFDSKDDIAQYLELIRAKNIKYISIPDAERYDRAYAYNIGAKVCSGDILVFSEADLLFPKYSLRMIRDHIISHENEFVIVPQKELDKLETCAVIGKTYSDYAEMLKKMKIEERPSTPACVVVEKQHFEEIGGFDEDYTGESHEVVDIVDRLQQHRIVKREVPDVYVLHMWHNELPKDQEGYFWQLYHKKRHIETPVRNQNREWGVIVKKRPRVLQVLSPRVWESGTIHKYVKQFAKRYYDVHFSGAREELRGRSTKPFDIVMCMDWKQPKLFRSNTSRFVTGVFDFISWNDGIRHDVPTSEILERLKLFEAVCVPCRQLAEIFAEFHPNTFYTPVAVDTEFFKPLKESRRISGNFTVGWVGKPEPEHTIEGYQEHVKPICNQLEGVDLFSAPGGEDKNGPMQMLGFYNAIDVLVYFHETSGDCKSILEAMSCGVPVITTRVGDAAKIIESGATGMIIPRNEEALTEAVVLLKNKKDYRVNMGEAARESVVKKWDWRDKIYYWKRFFDFVMEIE